jgi:hypothetical protein
MVNEDVIDLYGRVDVGTKVIVCRPKHIEWRIRPRRSDRRRCRNRLGRIARAHPRFIDQRFAVRAPSPQSTLRGPTMNSSFFTCDRATHLKIVAVALVAGIVVIVATIRASTSDTSGVAANAKTNGVVVKAPANRQFFRLETTRLSAEARLTSLPAPVTFFGIGRYPSEDGRNEPLCESPTKLQSISRGMA